MGTSLRQIGAGFLLGALSLAAVLGGFALSQAESGQGAVGLLPTQSVPAAGFTVYPTIPLLTFTPISTSSTAFTETPAPTGTEPPTFTPPPPPLSCMPPAGWQAIQVQGYETVASLAQRYQTSPEIIKQGNCLFSDQLVSGSFLYVPPIPTATFIPCGAPYGWVEYLVAPGDTLYSLSMRYRVSVAELQRANCLGNSTFIASGKPIKVPNVFTSTVAVKTPTGTSTATLFVASPTFTATFLPATPTASVTPEAPSPTMTLPAPTLTTVPPTQTSEPTVTSTEPAPTGG